MHPAPQEPRRRRLPRAQKNHPGGLANAQKHRHAHHAPKGAGQWAAAGAARLRRRPWCGWGSPRGLSKPPPWFAAAERRAGISPTVPQKLTLYNPGPNSHLTILSDTMLPRALPLQNRSQAINMAVRTGMRARAINVQGGDPLGGLEGLGCNGPTSSASP